MRRSQFCAVNTLHRTATVRERIPPLLPQAVMLRFPRFLEGQLGYSFCVPSIFPR